MPAVSTLRDETFRALAELMHAEVGLSFSASKKPLVSSRLGPRIQRLGLDGFDAYLELIGAAAGEAGDAEFQVAVDLLTTNETYFMREPAHFQLLEEELRAQRPPAAAVWSAASSFGDEAYSVAMLLADLQQSGRIGADWSVLGTDISDRVLRCASQGVFPLERLRLVEAQRLRRHCLRGEGEAEGLVQMAPALRRRVSFGRLNLCRPIEPLGPFDAIFLRNVLIYFDAETKRAVVDRVLERLRPGGLFFVGTAEGRVDSATPLQRLAAGAFRKPAR
jgi:chemotaxis protein methyltransferase CheR